MSLTAATQLFLRCDCLTIKVFDPSVCFMNTLAKLPADLKCVLWGYLPLPSIIRLRQFKCFSTSADLIIRERFHNLSKLDYECVRNQLKNVSKGSISKILSIQSNSDIVKFILAAYFINDFNFFEPYSRGDYDPEGYLTDFANFLEERKRCREDIEGLSLHAKINSPLNRALIVFEELISKIGIVWQRSLELNNIAHHTVIECIGESHEPVHLFLKGIAMQIGLNGKNFASKRDELAFFVLLSLKFPLASHHVGLFHLHERRYHQAGCFFEKSAKYGWPPSLTMIYDLLPKEHRGLAVEFLRAAVRKNYLPAYLKLGTALMSSNPEESKRLLIIPAKRGDRVAQCRLAHLYLRERQIDQASYWYRRSAENGNSEAAYEYGALCYYQHKAQAFFWMRKSHLFENPSAMNFLGEEYENQELYEEAARWYQRASKLKCVLADAHLHQFHVQKIPFTPLNEGIKKTGIRDKLRYKLTSLLETPDVEKEIRFKSKPG